VERFGQSGRKGARVGCTAGVVEGEVVGCSAGFRVGGGVGCFAGAEVGVIGEGGLVGDIVGRLHDCTRLPVDSDGY